jgi:hypothetical protein
MSPTEISTVVVGVGGFLVTVLTLFFNRRAQAEQRRDAEAARAFERMERENDRLREQLADERKENERMRTTLRENDALREFLLDRKLPPHEE